MKSKFTGTRDSATTTALLIVNPHSRFGKESELADSVARLESAGFRVIRADSGSVDQCHDEIARHRDQVDLVILAGGDGTVHSAAPALVEHRLAFAVLPLGTANDLARSLGIPPNLDEATDAIIAGQRRCIDIGTANGELFFNAVNIGLGATITHELSPEEKKSWGVLSYLKGLFRALSQYRPFTVTIEVDGKTHRMRSIQVGIGNGRFYGGGNVIEETAAITDGMLHLYSIRPQPMWALLLQARLFRSGRQGRSADVFTAVGRVIRVRTSRRLEVHTDGEPATATPVQLGILPRTLEAVTGQHGEAVETVAAAAVSAQ